MLHWIEAEARSNKRLGASTSENEPTKYGHYGATGFLGRASTQFPAQPQLIQSSSNPKCGRRGDFNCVV